ncbi:hypothetical protein BDA99DRAFT_509457 [Phascolomyces articulosus]|uniref:Uncharacterized protein n=1 Tax=Phascolomyces articulosus TaxID=60185 RepID=A0AAD5K083_9FUNG|nr:hypothetical protein BDA99DRAFT_509457 [Phascolomyces articulosus]
MRDAKSDQRFFLRFFFSPSVVFIAKSSKSIPSGGRKFLLRFDALFNLGLKFLNGSIIYLLWNERKWGLQGPMGVQLQLSALLT